MNVYTNICLKYVKNGDSCINKFQSAVKIIIIPYAKNNNRK